MNCIVLFLSWVLRGQSLQSMLEYNFPNMHAMSYRSGFFASSCRVNIKEPAVQYCVTLLLAFSQVRLPSFLIPTAMLDWQYFNTSLLEVMISSNNQHVLIRDLSELAWQIIFAAWWQSITVGSKRPIACNDSTQTPSWWFNLHCGIDDTGSSDIICIICHHVLCHSSEHGTSSMSTNLLGKDHNAKLNKLSESVVTELTSSMVNETALAILKRQGIQRITIGSLRTQMIFHIQVNPYWPKWHTKRPKQAGEDFQTSKFNRDMWNRYLMLECVSAWISLNAIWHLELRQSFKTLCDNLDWPSAMTISNISRREHALTVDSIKKQLPSWRKDSLALHGWTLTNKLPITLGIAYCMDRNWALREVQLDIDEVDCVFFTTTKSEIRMIGQGPIYCSKACCKFEGRAGLFSA